MSTLTDITKYGKLLHDNKLVIGSGGNISVRIEDEIIIKKKGADMSEGSTNSYISMPFTEAEKLESAVLSSETPFHIACYKARENIGAIIHIHSPYTIAAANKTDLLENISYEFDCIIKTPVPVTDFITPGSTDLANEISSKTRQGANAVLMKKHGAIAVGSDLKEAYLRTLALERACQAVLFF